MRNRRQIVPATCKNVFFLRPSHNSNVFPHKPGVLGAPLSSLIVFNKAAITKNSATIAPASSHISQSGDCAVTSCVGIFSSPTGFYQLADGGVVKNIINLLVAELWKADITEPLYSLKTAIASLSPEALNWLFFIQAFSQAFSLLFHTPECISNFLLLSA